MTKPRGPLPELDEDRKADFCATHPDAIAGLLRIRQRLLLELHAAGWSHRMLAQLYGVTHNTIRYWLREPTSAKAPGYPRGRRGV